MKEEQVRDTKEQQDTEQQEDMQELKQIFKSWKSSLVLFERYDLETAQQPET